MKAKSNFKKTEVESILENIKNYLEKKEIDYYDIRLEKSKKTGIVIDNNKVRTIGDTEITGIGIRIYKNKKLGFCSTTNIDNYKLIIDECIRATEKLTKKTDMQNFAANKATIKYKHKSFEDSTLESKVNELLKINNEIINKNNQNYKLLESEIRYKEDYTEKYFVNPWSYIYQDEPYIMMYSFMTGKRNEIIETNLNRFCKKGGLDAITLEKKNELLFENTNILGELLVSKPCNAIKANIVLDPEVVGLLAHEAIGHPCEADAKLVNATVLKKKGIILTKNKDVTIVDDPTSNGFGHMVYDDEGIRANKTTLIKNGVVNDYMTNIETATIENEKSNGSARAESFSSMPIVRMSNTFFLPGKDKHKDMLTDFSGYYLKGFAGGMVDPSIGTFMFGIKQAIKYDKGNIIGTFKQASISGNILTYLNNITKIGNIQHLEGSGFCGKANQTAYVGDGGPFLKINNVIIGGTNHE